MSKEARPVYGSRKEARPVSAANTEWRAGTPSPKRALVLPGPVHNGQYSRRLGAERQPSSRNATALPPQ